MKKLGIVAIVILGLVAVVVAVFLPGKTRTDAINREDGDRIVNALEAYQRANHTYPAELSQLVPKFIPQVPPQHRQNGELTTFHYQVSDDTRGYVLSYQEASIGPFSADAAFEYDSRVQEWKNHIY